MDWSTLLSVAVGGLIAVIPIVISNRHQAKEREKDRSEQRREAKTQLALELIRNDARLVQDNINNYLQFIDELQVVKDKSKPTSLSDEKVVYLFLKDHLASDDKLQQLYEFSAMADMIVLGFGDDFSKEYKDFRDKCKAFFDLAISDPSRFIGDDVSISSIISSAGKLHVLMREKLISLRE